MDNKVIFSWSGGKDSALALYEINKNNNYNILSLLTTATKEYKRISMHGVKISLLKKQTEALNIKLEIMLISKNATSNEYDKKMKKKLLIYKKQGVSYVIFGDIFLEEIRKYREEKLSKIGMKGIFPLWKKDTKKIAKMFIDLGFKAIVTCVDTNFLDKKFVGRIYDKHFLNELPINVDPCGENGEFHSFVYDGPIFKKKIYFKVGDIVLRDKRFCFCDLIPE
jgi:uncharacterized protein (TIGR00290 family)